MGGSAKDGLKGSGLPSEDANGSELRSLVKPPKSLFDEANGSEFKLPKGSA